MLPRLAQLMGASQWAADYLTRHPILLDELLDPRVLLAEPDWDAWRTELARMLAADAGDAERQMDALRHFQHAQTFRLLAQDLAGTLTVERLADHLSALADIILAATLAEVWAHMRNGAHDGAAAEVRDHRLRQARRQGAGLRVRSRPRVPLRRRATRRRVERYTRLARRLITWLTSATAAGPPVRHRPAVAAGRRQGRAELVARRILAATSASRPGRGSIRR